MDVMSGADTLSRWVLRACSWHCTSLSTLWMSLVYFDSEPHLGSFRSLEQDPASTQIDQLRM
ncbi:hypothetical protein K474DRAFT_1664106 [Panus rudis PR-1116 ss-1]|nr:hypothetical protein K474DRAFT_1664106 [Panus rudis PR-1116 ss-1]